jgi:hypothetical protein
MQRCLTDGDGCDSAVIPAQAGIQHHVLRRVICPTSMSLLCYAKRVQSELINGSRIQNLII